MDVRGFFSYRFACANKNVFDRGHRHEDSRVRQINAQLGGPRTIKAGSVNEGGRAVRGGRRVNFRLPLFTWGEAGASRARGGAAAQGQGRAAGTTHPGGAAPAAR